jgi:P27 family predicted phage terminase small subunit
MPTMPADLGAIAKTEWEALAPALHRMGVLTSVDGRVLEAYCRYYEQYTLATRAIALEGTTVLMENGRPMMSPQVTIANAASDRMHRYMSELGLTPASRAKLGSTAPADDPLEALLRSKPTPRRKPNAEA